MTDDNDHVVGKCDICHHDFTSFGLHGIIYGVNNIVRYCDECWEEAEKE